MKAKSRKKIVLTGAARFNTKPKTGLAFLEENKIIYAEQSPAISRETSLAMFLKGCPRIDKRLLGDFISKPEHIDILKAFIDLFDFKDVRRMINVLRCVSHPKHARNLYLMPYGNFLRVSASQGKHNRYHVSQKHSPRATLRLNQVVFHLD